MGGIIIYSNLFVSSSHLQPDTAQGLSTTPAPGNTSLGVDGGALAPKGPPQDTPKMPLLVEWTFIMDWHELEKIPFGIREYRHGEGRQGPSRERGGGLVWLQGGWLPSQPPHICRSPTNAHCVCVCALHLSDLTQ